MSNKLNQKQASTMSPISRAMAAVKTTSAQAFGIKEAKEAYGDAADYLGVGGPNFSPEQELLHAV